MENFNFYNPTKIHFGSNQLDNLYKIVLKYGNRCMLVTTPYSEKVLQPLYNKVLNQLKDNNIFCIHFDQVVPNPTVQSIEKAIKLVKENKIEVIIGLGGGSSIDTAKSIALFYQPDKINWDNVYQTYTSPFAEYEKVSNPVLPLITIPTTSGTGSELTQAMVISDDTNDEKVCIFHDKVFPLESIIDVNLTLTLPSYLTAITGFDAFCHAFESFMRDESSVYTKTIGFKAMSLIIETLPKLLKDLKNIKLRENMSIAEMFAGISLSNAAATVPHPLSEIIGGICPFIPHGQALATIYTSFIKFQINKTPEKCGEVAKLFDKTLVNKSDIDASKELPRLITSFIKELNLDKSLSSLNVKEEDFEKMRNHFLLTVLPFGTKEELENIIVESY